MAHTPDKIKITVKNTCCDSHKSQADGIIASMQRVNDDKEDKFRSGRHDQPGKGNRVESY